MYRLFFLTLMTLLLSNNILAQTNDSNASLVEDTTRDLYIITGAGLGGAVLGLSTLSFVSEPSDHYKNIIVGASIGIIGGVIVVAMLQAERTNQYVAPEYTNVRFENLEEFDTTSRKQWHQENFSQNLQGSSLALFGYNKSF